MARTMKWPPTPEQGRLPFVEGIDATNIVVIQTLSDLQANPFNDPLLSLGEVTFKDPKKVEARVTSVLTRLRALIDIEAILVDRSKAGDEMEVVVHFQDREIRQKSEVTVNG